MHCTFSHLIQLDVCFSDLKFFYHSCFKPPLLNIIYSKALLSGSCSDTVQLHKILNVIIQRVMHYDHRLNGSSSPVLTATSLSYGKAKNSIPHRIKTHDQIEIKFGTVDYVGEMTPRAKFHVNLHKGGFSANRWNIRKNFYIHIPFFSQFTYRSDPSADFCVR